MIHPDVEFARRHRINTTERARIEAHVLDYADSNFIKVQLHMKNMSEAVECEIGVIKMHQENAWQVTTVRAPKPRKTFYRFESQLVENIKDDDTTLEECFAVYDAVMKQMPK